LSDRSYIKNRSNHSKGSRSEKIQRCSQFPKICTNQRAGTNDQIAHQIIRPNHLSAPLRFAVSDNERFARRVAKFLETANRECDREQSEAVCWKTVRDQQADRK